MCDIDTFIKTERIRKALIFNRLPGELDHLRSIDVDLALTYLQAEVDRQESINDLLKQKNG